METLDLFCGCGGMSLGFMEAGCNIIEAHDNWDAAVQTYSENFNHPVYKTDLADYQRVVPLLIEKKADLVIGGPPCQEFSSAGKRRELEKADLTVIFSSIISSIKPKYFVMENVERCARSNAYKNARKIFKDAGYGLTQLVLNAALCGVPQRRKRFFVIGAQKKSDNFLSSVINKNLSGTEMTMRDYFENRLEIDHYYRHPRNYNRRGIFSMDEPSPTVRGVNRPIPAGYKGHSADTTILSEKVRPLTTRERAMVQTFPEEFKLPKTKTDTEQLIGNAVPVNMANFVAKCLLEYEKDTRRKN